jgi:hypothetical protein
MRKIALLFAVLTAVSIAALSSASAAPHATYSKPVLLVGTDPIGAALGNGARQAVGEPSIKVDSKGAVYITGADTVGRPAPAWYSANGKSFTELPSPADARQRTMGAEGDFAIDDHDNVYMIDTAVPYLVLSKWSNHGKTWDVTYPVAAGVIPGLDDRPWLAWARGSLWLFVNHGAGIDVYKSTDQGMSFQLLYTTVGGSGNLFPGVVAADDSKASKRYGSFYVFGDCGSEHQMCSAATRDGGATWKEAKIPAITGARSRLAPQLSLSVDVDKAGNVYGVWSADDVKAPSSFLGNETNGTGCTVYLTESRDGASTWSKPVAINHDPRGCATFPAISAGAPGKVVVGYYQETASAAAQDHVANKAPWFLHVEYNTNALKSPRGFTDSIADPKPVLLGPLMRRLWDFFQVDVGPDGRANIAYSRATGAGKDGPVGCGCAPDELGAQRAKDLMYVKETNGPNLG